MVLGQSQELQEVEGAPKARFPRPPPQLPLCFPAQMLQGPRAGPWGSGFCIPSPTRRPADRS